MKKIEAIIRPEKLNDLLEALNKHQFYGVTVSQVMGAGLQRGRTHFYRGNEIITNLHPKTKLEIVVKDSWVNEVIETIIEITKTGNVGDGKIFIYDIENAYRIRTGQSGEDALV